MIRGWEFRFIILDSGCGGVYSAKSGEISYKDNSSYADNEKCVWLVEVPQAETIVFNLEKAGMEACCDYITISSVDAFKGIDIDNEPTLLTLARKFIIEQ